jgi:putative methyltransferase (TIGR04325 family)
MCGLDNSGVLMASVVVHAVKQILKRLPIVRDFYSYFFGFYRNRAACRGLFTSMSEAMAAVPCGERVGYNQPTISTQGNVAQYTAARNYDQFDTRDEPILRELRQLIKENTRIFDIGGNVGTEYYAYRQRMRIPEGVRWIVCEISEIAEAGRRLACEKGSAQLEFTTEFEAVESSDILLTCGTLQYMDQCLGTLLRGILCKPAHVLVNRVAMYDGPSFVTLQNIGYSYCPYFVRNRKDFLCNMDSAGYRLEAEWRDHRVTRIPFHWRHTINGYRGFTFTLT